LSNAQQKITQLLYTIAVYIFWGSSCPSALFSSITAHKPFACPLDVRLPEGVQKVDIRVKGNERIITPLGQTWDSFFLGGPTVSDDFLPERATQQQSEREAL